VNLDRTVIIGMDRRPITGKCPALAHRTNGKLHHLFNSRTNHSIIAVEVNGRRCGGYKLGDVFGRKTESGYFAEEVLKIASKSGKFYDLRCKERLGHRR